jgi:hypothetical protein
MRALKWLPLVVCAWGCGAALGCSSADTGAEPPLQAADAGADSSNTACGHRVDADAVNLGFNTVVDSTGAAQSAQGKPLQEGWTLVESTSEISVHNDREYARIASFMMPIRDALMCDIATVDEADWLSLTQVLTLNDIKMEQDLSGTPPERVYSTEGIYELLRAGEDFHPMMKYLEEAELELKCIAFQDFDFTNPEGDDHCAIHGLPVGQGLTLP